jgi:hypothetical protein
LLGYWFNEFKESEHDPSPVLRFYLAETMEVEGYKSPWSIILSKELRVAQIVETRFLIKPESLLPRLLQPETGSSPDKSSPRLAIHFLKISCNIIL